MLCSAVSDTSGRCGAGRLSELFSLNGGFLKNRGYFWGEIPHCKDYDILGSVLGYPYFGKLPMPAGDLGVYKHSFVNMALLKTSLRQGVFLCRGSWVCFQKHQLC